MGVSIASPLMQPSLNGRRVGIRIVTFDLLRLHSRYGPPVAQPLKAAFVMRLQPCRLPGRTVRQLPDQSTTLWVESSSTSDPRPSERTAKSDLEVGFADPHSMQDSGKLARNRDDRTQHARPFDDPQTPRTQYRPFPDSEQRACSCLAQCLPNGDAKQDPQR
jgi:hypothetical protein